MKQTDPPKVIGNQLKNQMILSPVKKTIVIIDHLIVSLIQREEVKPEDRPNIERTRGEELLKIPRRLTMIIRMTKRKTRGHLEELTRRSVTKNNLITPILRIFLNKNILMVMMEEKEQLMTALKPLKK